MYYIVPGATNYSSLYGPEALAYYAARLFKTRGQGAAGGVAC